VSRVSKPVANSLQEARIALAQASVALGARGLGDWDNFLVALRAYDREVQKLFVQSPIDQLQQIQGRAQASAQLLEVFETCKKIAETANQNRKVEQNERRLGDQ